jgi:hypothetical protein
VPWRPSGGLWGIAITQRFRFLSATNSLSFRFCDTGKGTLGIDRAVSGRASDKKQIASALRHSGLDQESV